jgi:purine nucleoside phosphorylase
MVEDQRKWFSFMNSASGMFASRMPKLIGTGGSGSYPFWGEKEKNHGEDPHQHVPPCNLEESRSLKHIKQEVHNRFLVLFLLKCGKSHFYEGSF